MLVCSVAAAAPASITSESAAIDRFVAAWAEHVRPLAAKNDTIRPIDKSMREAGARKRFTAKRGACRDTAHTVETMNAQMHHDFVLFGSLAVAHTDHSCWAVTYTCCRSGDTAGLIDADTGSLLVAWRIPEG